jgi:hypothetical protein
MGLSLHLRSVRKMLSNDSESSVVHMTLRLQSIFDPTPSGKSFLLLTVNRAKFGQDRVRNAVHCTDLPEDGVLECKYFFDILQQHQF